MTDTDMTADKNKQQIFFKPSFFLLVSNFDTKKKTWIFYYLNYFESCFKR